MDGDWRLVLECELTRSYLCNALSISEFFSGAVSFQDEYNDRGAE